MRIKLILDPWAGRSKGKRFLPQIMKILGRGNLLDVSLTKGPLHACLLAQEIAGRNYDVIVAGCGDGTLNEVINGILRARRDLPLGFIPLGMSNTAAYGLGIPQDPIKACEVILKKRTKRVDLGKFIKPAQHYFLSLAEFGYTASLVHRAESGFKLKSLLGKLYYWLCAYPVVFSYKFSPLTVKIDGIIREGYHVWICNSGFYMGEHRIAPQIKNDDGYLDVCIFEKGGMLNAQRYFYLGVVPDRLPAFPGVRFYRAKRVSITSPEKVPGALDGNPFGFTPAEIEIAPQILPVIVP